VLTACAHLACIRPVGMRWTSMRAIAELFLCLRSCRGRVYWAAVQIPKRGAHLIPSFYRNLVRARGGGSLCLVAVSTRGYENPRRLPLRATSCPHVPV